MLMVMVIAHLLIDTNNLRFVRKPAGLNNLFVDLPTTVVVVIMMIAVVMVMIAVIVVTR